MTIRCSGCSKGLVEVESFQGDPIKMQVHCPFCFHYSHKIEITSNYSIKCWAGVDIVDIHETEEGNLMIVYTMEEYDGR